MAEAIRIRATAHSFEGKVFTIVACSTVSEEIIAAMSADRPQNRDLLERPNSAFSGVIDPHGNLIGEALIDEEGIVYAEIDLGDCVRPKLMHDIIGGYNRFDIFNLTVDRTPRASALFVDEIPPADEPSEEEA
jgi:aliphatic nitrilase